MFEARQRLVTSVATGAVSQWPSYALAYMTLFHTVNRFNFYVNPHSLFDHQAYLPNTAAHGQAGVLVFFLVQGVTLRPCQL